MPHPTGTPIWYELITPDPGGAKRFYDDVMGWTVDPPAPGTAGYGMINAPCGLVAGIFELTQPMQQAGARPSWLPYFATDDVDATADQARARGGHLHMPPTDVPDVGRFALLADPQGAPFYLMHPANAHPAAIFAPGEPGRCGWNELCTQDLPAALAFYGALFGWQNRETMDMGKMGGYHFLDLGALRIGGAVQMNRPAHWNLYFNVPDIDHAAARIPPAGGTIEVGPHDIPTGQRILIATDPQGAHFALVGPGRAAGAVQGQA